AASAQRYPLSLHDALPIWIAPAGASSAAGGRGAKRAAPGSEERGQVESNVQEPAKEVVDPDCDIAGGGLLHLDDVPTFERHVVRSEEHTSELQSRENLVCR